MSTNEETLSCPHCKNIVTTSKTLGFGPDKVVTCGKCGKKHTLGDARNFAHPLVGESEAVRVQIPVPPPTQVLQQSSDSSEELNREDNYAFLKSRSKRRPTKLRKYTFLKAVIYTSHIAGLIFLFGPLVLITVAAVTSQARENSPWTGLMFSLPSLGFLPISLVCFLSSEVSRLMINIANDVQIIADKG